MYDSPHQFEPLLPDQAKQEVLLAKAHDLSRQALGLSRHPAPIELRGLLRGMNSYYTNRIEGQHTRPLEIEQALRRDFSNDGDVAAKQHSPDAVSSLHRSLFAHLPAADLVMPEGPAIVPGQFRQREVSVGRHIAPTAASVPEFLQRWGGFYGDVRRGEAQLLALAAAHQRLGWIHPFVDGNGRVMRLHTHAWVCPQYQALLRLAGRCRRAAPG
jgi:Fic family protein